MGKYFYCFVMSAVALCQSGCGNSGGELLRLVEERDSLRRANEMQHAKLAGYEKAVDMMNATLDSIAVQERMIFVGTGEAAVTKDDVRNNLLRFETLLRLQENKIDALEAQLAERDDSLSGSMRLISHLKSQIRTKNVQIAHLSEELEKKNVDISTLREQVESQRVRIETQTVTIENLNRQTRRQSEALARQDVMLNNGYVLIGSKDDLNRKGVTRRGKLVADAAIDRSKFFKVDIREWREVSFRARRPKILTDMPSSSYELTTSGDGNFTLTVKNPADFWRISSYLVIQTN